MASTSAITLENVVQVDDGFFVAALSNGYEIGVRTDDETWIVTDEDGEPVDLLPVELAVQIVKLVTQARNSLRTI